MKKINKFWYILTAFIFCIGALIGIAARWIGNNFTTGIQEILFTINNPMQGANTDFVSMGVRACLPLVLLIWTVIVLVAVKDYKSRIQISLSGKIFGISCKILLSAWMRFIAVVMSFVCLFFSVAQIDAALGIGDFIKLRCSPTTIYEAYYVHPETVAVEAEKPKNLIYIYLESMETNFQSREEGGLCEVNLIPNLTRLAKENISFSHNQKVGGFRSLGGTYWTTGALLGSSSGVPFSFPVEGSSMNQYTYFAPGLVTLGDILEEKGYNQEFLCGSDADFGGRKSLFVQHGNYEIFDLMTARKKGYIAEDYYVWWGFEDKILYEIAKDEATRLYAENKPFNLTMLTVDTHMVGGYVCDLCGTERKEAPENVILCADHQVNAFVEWCKEQPFYEDTVIVISGDHMCRDTSVIGEIDDYDHIVYNCFINADCEGTFRTENRDFSSLDMFPTVLAAMGYTIEGDRLGLGTNMFSDQQTLAEKMGLEIFGTELYKYSDYYMECFAQ